MRFENIIKQLKKDGERVYEGEFEYKPVPMVSGTALIDLVDNEIILTSAKYTDVLKQIREGKSHIQTIEIVNGCKKKTLTPYKKYGA